MLIGLGIRIISTAYWRRQVSFFRSLNRYRRGLETCPQAKTFKSERSATTLFFSLFFRRVRATSMTQLRVPNTRVHFWTFSPVSLYSYILSPKLSGFDIFEAVRTESWVQFNFSHKVDRDYKIILQKWNYFVLKEFFQYFWFQIRC